MTNNFLEEAPDVSPFGFRLAGFDELLSRADLAPRFVLNQQRRRSFADVLLREAEPPIRLVYCRPKS
jgi:hypothetical protein